MLERAARAELGHYRLQEKIGSGGMGEVYLAVDEHLGRRVAIKVLPQNTFRDEAARRRFRTEARALSRINHPNVATIFDFSADGETDFLVMEYIPGTTLDEVVAKRLPEAEIIRLAAQIAEGIEAAHAEGVLHRDLKPGNIRITQDGRVKILDFGLAKLRVADEGDPTESVAQTRTVKGTLPYMAPEQLCGSSDARTDIYALGVILFQLTTGRLPFESAGPITLADSILHTPCPPPGRLNPQLSTRLEEIILKCLEKDASARYQSVKDLLVDLGRVNGVHSSQAAVSPGTHTKLGMTIAGAAVAVVFASAFLFNAGGIRSRLVKADSARIESIAVLPLANLSGDPAQEYFVDGMTDELITKLSKIGSLKVISRTSVMRFKNSNTPLPEIARQLKVDAVIEGSVMRSGNRVRINAQLIAADDRHLWADTFDRDLRDVLTLSSEVTRAIADQVRAKLTPQEDEQLAAVRPVDSDAYEAYLQGQYFSQRSDFAKAAHYFEMATQKDPNFVAAWYNLAEATGMIAFLEGSPPRKYAPPGENKVMQLAPESAEAYIIRGDVNFYGKWDWSACERDFGHAVDLAPRNLQALEHYALCLSALKRTDESISILDRARELDPLSPIVYIQIGDALGRARQYDGAAQYYRQALELDPQNGYTHSMLSFADEKTGKRDEAAEEYRKAIRSWNVNTREVEQGEGVLAREGLAAFRRWVAKREISKLQQKSRTEYVSPYLFARLYTTAGDNQQALHYLEETYKQKIPNLVWITVAPIWDPLRSDPRFADLLRRINYPGS